ncbi:MAG: hypothetical protein K0Q74_1412 [Gammaproteobacteria bacterium]|jgi:hypothetical protein|nr:hypothetical protein [Gammaproteobacteria bacterium]
MLSVDFAITLAIALSSDTTLPKLANEFHLLMLCHQPLIAITRQMILAPSAMQPFGNLVSHIITSPAHMRRTIGRVPA